jgi:riboflavin transporter FmnP
MTKKELSELTDQELLDKAKKTKTASVTNALLIGFCVGIIIFSFVKSTLGFFTLIPLYFIYKVVNNSKGLGEELKARNLK